MHLARLKRLQAALAQANFDGAVTIAGPNLFYLTGLSFHLSERPMVGFFPAHGDPVLVAGALEQSKVINGKPYPLRAFYYNDSDGPAAAFREASQALRFGKARVLPGRREGRPVPPFGVGVVGRSYCQPNSPSAA